MTMINSLELGLGNLELVLKMCPSPVIASRSAGAEGVAIRQGHPAPAVVARSVATWQSGGVPSFELMWADAFILRCALRKLAWPLVWSLFPGYWNLFGACFLFLGYSLFPRFVLRICLVLRHSCFGFSVPPVFRRLA